MTASPEMLTFILAAIIAVASAVLFLMRVNSKFDKMGVEIDTLKSAQAHVEKKLDDHAKLATTVAVMCEKLSNMATDVKNVETSVLHLTTMAIEDRRTHRDEHSERMSR